MEGEQMNEVSSLHAVGGVRLNLTEEQAETIRLLIGMSLHEAVQGVR